MPDFDIRAFMTSVRRVAGEGFRPRLTCGRFFSLLRLKDTAFLHEAYRALLGREPDECGLKGYAARSRTVFGRLIILTSLILSPEQTWVPDPLRRILTKIRGAHS